MAFIITLVAGAGFMLLQIHAGSYRYLELGIFRYRNTWIGILIFLLVMLVNTPSQMFIGSFAKLGSAAGNLEAQALMKYAIYGCLLGVILSLILILRRMRFRTLFALGFMLMAVSNAYMYFLYQTDSDLPSMRWPMLLNYMGWIMPYAVVCAHGMKNLPAKFLPTWLFLIVTVRNVMAPAIGVSVYSNWLQERTQFHKELLASEINHSNNVAVNTYNTTQRIGAFSGNGTFDSEKLASIQLSARVQKQATIVAFKDMTGTTVWLCLGCMLICLLLPYRKKEFM
ncbi:hypothetical protein EZ315_08595 [Duncaniella freteri]|uniref:MFS transporter n=1 Tax=Duncaniella freteri TaxID=2530391 RepID=A0A4Z0V8H5_9BACT|nr:hypothetical protein [Duncaniella freteri]TGG40714.1 hypothetical protein EZ315_08595 [Duncaniella freteri]